MSEGRHYEVDFVTFARILGLREEDREFTEIYNESRMIVKDVAFMCVDRRSVAGKVKGLNCYFYILNNSFPRMEQHLI